MRRVVGKVLRVDAVADHRGLVAHDVDPVEDGVELGLGGVAQVEQVHVGRRGVASARSVGHRQVGVETDHLVPALGEPQVDARADEPGGAGEQDPHGSSNGSVMPSTDEPQAQSRSPRVPTTVASVDLSVSVCSRNTWKTASMLTASP